MKVGLTAGVVTVLVNHAVGNVKDRASTSRDARYLALRIAVILEKFAAECADRLFDMAELHNSPDKNRAIPPLAPYPPAADWKALVPALASRSLSFRDEVDMSASAVRTAWEIDTEIME